MSKSVLIVGAGVAGLSAAKKLLQIPGYSVNILEGSEGIGGRVCSAKFGDGMVEVGAQWVHGQHDNRTFSLVHSFGVLDPNSTVFRANFVTGSGVKLPADTSDKMEELMDIVLHVKDSEKGEGMGHYVSREFWRLSQEYNLHESRQINSGLLDWIHRFQNTVDGCDHWDAISCQGEVDYKSCEGNKQIAWKAPYAYSTLFDIILNDAPRADLSQELEIPDWIHLNKIVKNISYSTSDASAEVVVKCTDSSEYRANHVIFTPSLGVLKKNHSTLFSPPLPLEKVNSIEHLGIGCVNKIYLEFNDVWWDEDFTGISLIFDDVEEFNDNWIDEPSDEVLLKEHDGFPVWCRSLLGFYKLPSQPRLLYTWIQGWPGRLIERLPKEELEKSLHKVLQKFIGDKIKVPFPSNSLRSQWASNPLICGSYSFRSLITEEKNASATSLSQPILANEKPVICFAGEATHPYYFSTVHGAYDTGVREAERIFKFYGEEEKEFCCSLLATA